MIYLDIRKGNIRLRGKYQKEIILYETLRKRGYYQVIYYSVAPAAIAEIERRFRINEDLLRFVTIKYDTNREITAWNKLVEKANKAATPAKEEPKEEAKVETEATEAPAEQEA